MLPVTAAFILHFALMIQTLSLSANSIAREKQANNWDMLVLTGVDARKIIRGKWSATVRRMWRSYFVLSILRAAVIIWFGTSTSRVFALTYNFAPGYAYALPNLDIPTPLNFFTAMASVFAFTMVNLLFTAACGVSAFNKRGSLGLALALSTRILLLVGLSGAIVLFSAFLSTYTMAIAPYDYTFLSIWAGIVDFLRAIASTLIENGLSVSAMWVTYHNVYSPTLSFNLLLASGVAFAFYLLLTVLLLRFAQWQAVRQNALPPLSPPAAKSTYNA
jgi:hypothetical protein